MAKRSYFWRPRRGCAASSGSANAAPRPDLLALNCITLGVVTTGTTQLSRGDGAVPRSTWLRAPPNEVAQPAAMYAGMAGGMAARRPGL